MSKFGWKIGMYIFAGLMLSCILFGAIMKPPPRRRVPPANKEKISSEPTNVVEVKTIRFALSIVDEPHFQPLIPTKADEPAVHSSHVSISTSESAGGQGRGPEPDDPAHPFYKKDALYTGSKSDLHRLSRTSLRSNPQVNTATKVEEKTTSKAFADILAAMTDFSILKNKKLLLICIGNIFSMLGYYLPIMCLVSFAVEDLQVNRSKAPFLLSLIHISEPTRRS